MSDHSTSQDQPLPGLPGSGNLAVAQNYTHRLLHGGSLATRLSHRGRIATSYRVLEGQHFPRAADVGAADGWYLRGLIERGIVTDGTAIDADPTMLEAGRAAAVDWRLRFLTPDHPDLLAAHGSFDLVTCLETLEHVDDPVTVLDHTIALARPGGTLLISVPIEVGPSLLLKQFGRWRANRHGTYSYERYRWPELMQAGLLWRSRGLQRQNLHSHKGFDYRAIRRALAARATITRTNYSPSARLGPILASTVFWVATTPSH